jgi:hypothetical protein
MLQLQGDFGNYILRNLPAWFIPLSEGLAAYYSLSSFYIL